MALRDLGYDIRIVLPAYRAVLAGVHDVKVYSEMLVPDTDIRYRLLETTLPDSDVPVYLVDIPALYDRPGSPYLAEDGKDWLDNAERCYIAMIGIPALQRRYLHRKANVQPSSLRSTIWPIKGYSLIQCSTRLN